ncbi:MAG TPA: hypothetical protein VGO16_03350 [Pseudonocardiaceae bacterium]|nr:hypothetical protein [Pseudonocardiaceae bacterium]
MLVTTPALYRRKVEPMRDELPFLQHVLVTGAEDPPPGTVESAFVDAAIERVCKAEVPVPYARHLEEAALPQPTDVTVVARRAVS